MLTLGIETSCDDTGLALVESGQVLAQVLASQEDLHAVFGGVVPEIASREHLRVLPKLFKLVLKRAGCGLKDIELIAVTRGPGLLASLLMGISFAKGLCVGGDKDLIGVDHLQAHLAVANLENSIEFPALGLVLSGGHTNLYRLNSLFELELLGRTLDDAIGEAFDKVAKLVNLPYPGGKFIDLLAREGEVDPGLLPKPYIDNTNLDFSFSGIKTAVLNLVRKHPDLVLSKVKNKRDDQLKELACVELKNLCASFCYTLTETLKIKIRRAWKKNKDIQSLVLAGGVASNSFIRNGIGKLAKELGLRMIVPKPELCTDNGVMIAYLGEKLRAKGWQHTLSLDAIPRGRSVPWDFISKKGSKSYLDMQERRKVD